MAKKKFILFIVEGLTEEVALYKALDNYLSIYQIKFEIVGGDILADYDTVPTNVLNKIGNLITQVKRSNFLQDSDILKVVHLVDTDGVYIDDGGISEDVEIEQYTYSSTDITCCDKRMCTDRNQRKQRLLNKIYSKKKLSECLYEVYFFSCNLDLVLYNIYNLSDSQKFIYAKSFEMNFKDDSNKFKNYMVNNRFSLGLKYYESWEFIKKDRNSLKRYSNFDIFINYVTEHNSK